MIILPKEKPVIEGLNTYYLNVHRLIEHCQGELGSGGVYFHSPSAEGVVFFDKDELLSGLYQGREGDLVKGDAAVEKLLAAVDEFNFSLNVYAIEPEKVYFWANIPSAEMIYRDLSTEFTDLDGLIKKMMSENLTGYIEASIKDGEESGLIFFINGQIIGGSYSWKQGELNGTQEARDELVQKTKKSGGSFHVSRISPSKGKAAPAPAGGGASSENVIVPLQELLDLLERTVRAGKFLRGEFNTALKKKFVEKADTYAFLDPFAGEFEYVDGKIRFDGDAPPEAVARGVTESVKELAQEVGAWPRFSEEIGPWTEKYAGMLSRYGLSF
ncbi:MAG: hypothetical protein K9M82_03985 [Deltaproteobacteria bacterium]|nr:hypothetical protein [Deltaproteobacteria bacterium]